MRIFKSKTIFQWGPNDGAPLTIHYSAISGVRELVDDLGISWPKTILTFKKDKMTWFNGMEELVDIGKETVKKIILKKEQNKKAIRLWKERINELTKVFKEIENTDLTKLSNDELMKLYKRYSKKYHEWFSIGMLAELVNFGAEELLREELLKKVEKSKVNDMLVVLCAPTRLSFYAEEEIDLLKITKKLEKHKKDILKGKYDFKKCKELTKHKEKYFWMLNNYYETKYLDEKYFFENIKKLLSENVNTEKEIEKILKSAEEAKKKKEQLIKEQKLDEKTVRFANIVDDFMHFQDERKQYNLMSDHYLDILLKEFGKRTVINFQDLKYLLHNEMQQLFEKDYKEIINKRKKICVVKYENRKYTALDEKTANKYYNELFKVKIESINEIKGIIANKGVMKGKVKVLLTIRELNKLKPGEILVTTMTTPDFIVAIKKAGAIVTDVGGLTCHAAIVSREMKIPCIVGTKIATKILKDGDLVEVDADKGIVKLIKRGVKK